MRVHILKSMTIELSDFKEGLAFENPEHYDMDLIDYISPSF